MQYSRFPDPLPDGQAPVIRTGFSPSQFVSAALAIGLVVETASVCETI